MTRSGFFSRLASAAARAAGHPLASLLAVVTVIIWAVLGPTFDFSEAWQLVINTGTTIVTFLMVFLIQNTQNRDSHAIQIKLDELIRVTAGAHNVLLDLEELSDSEIERIRQRYEELAQRSRREMRAGRADTGSPQVDVSEDAPRW